ncbi:MAG TPA: helix-turn-helix domain-containing protein [Vicinamibacteria bacterium]|nr:helix-turn-helix domain-containing protein [Vicinamibacteria bacterium]
MPRLRQHAVGEMVRRLREGRGLSLRGLGAVTDFSASFLSQLENGQVSPSISSMERIANALGVSLGEFFSSLGSNEGGVVVRAFERTQLQSQWSQATLEALSPMNRGRLIEPLLITLEPGGRSGKHPTAQPREEFAFVLAGAVQLTLGPDTYCLNEGDAATLLRGELRRWSNVGSVPARILIVAVI